MTALSGTITVDPGLGLPVVVYVYNADGSGAVAWDDADQSVKCQFPSRISDAERVYYVANADYLVAADVAGSRVASSSVTVNDDDSAVSVPTAVTP